MDDTGLVVICPKDKVDNLFVDYAKYIAVVGNGKYLCTKIKDKGSRNPQGIDENGNVWQSFAKDETMTLCSLSE